MKIYGFLTVLALAGTLAASPVSAQSGNGNGTGRGRAVGRQQDDRSRAAARERMRFRAMDTDNDGVITRGEWRGSDQSFREHDTNDDGVLSGEEVWVPAGSQQTIEDRSRREERLARFARADKNGDGRISFREWSGSEVVFDRMDRNGDEFITRDEFMEAAVERPTGTAGSRVTTRAYQAGYDKGREEGRQAGREDKSGPGKWDLEGQRELEQADSGYRNELGLREDYQAGYRAGFRIGYPEGFGPR